MKAVFAWLLGSRSIWIGAATVLVTAAVAKGGAWLGLSDDQCNQVAGAVIVVGLAIIAKLAVQNTAGILKKGGGGAPLCLLALGLAILASGCQAPVSVRTAQADELFAWQRFTANSERITAAAVEAYRQARSADIDYTTGKAIAAVQAKAVDGNIPAADLPAIIQEIVRRRDAAKSLTDDVSRKIQVLLAENRKEAAQALQLHAALRDYMEAGIDESSISTMIQEILTLVGAPATPAPLPSAAAPIAVPAPPQRE